MQASRSTGPGNMYGTAYCGGPNGGPQVDEADGMVWEITASGIYRDLHDFGGSITNADGSAGPDGINPDSSVAFDSAGNMYRTAEKGGPNAHAVAVGEFGDGMIREITASGIYRDLRDFGGTVTNAEGTSGPDGMAPVAGVAFDSAGTITERPSMAGRTGL